MKTKEFIESMEKLGFVIRTHDYIDGRKDLKILRKGSYFIAATVSENHENIFNTDVGDFLKLPPEKQNALFDLLVEYASTPVEEREEPKKYFIRHKHIRSDWNYLNFNIETKEWGINSDHETTLFRAHFTLEELPEWACEMLEQGHLVKEEVE